MRWTTKVTIAEVEQQVLAPAADEHERLAVGRRPGRGVAVLRAVKVRGEALEGGAGEGGVEPLGVGLDLGELRHGRAANTSSMAASAAGARRSRRAGRRRAAAGRDEGGLGGELAAVDRLGGRPVLGEGDVGASAPAGGRRPRRPVAVDRRRPRRRRRVRRCTTCCTTSAAGRRPRSTSRRRRRRGSATHASVRNSAIGATDAGIALRH